MKEIKGLEKISLTGLERSQNYSEYTKFIKGKEKYKELANEVLRIGYDNDFYWWKVECQKSDLPEKITTLYEYNFFKDSVSVTKKSIWGNDDTITFPTEYLFTKGADILEDMKRNEKECMK